MNKRENWNALPKKPTHAESEALKIPYFEQVKEMRDKMKSFAYVPAEHGGRDFKKMVPSNGTFSDGAFFKTIFAGGGDLTSQIAELRQSEIDTFRSKLIVTSTEFTVNTTAKPDRIHQIEKYKGMLEDPVTRPSFRLSRNQVKMLTERKVHATRDLSPLPVSQLSQENYVMNEWLSKP